PGGRRSRHRRTGRHMAGAVGVRLRVLPVLPVPVHPVLALCRARTILAWSVAGAGARLRRCCARARRAASPRARAAGDKTRSLESQVSGLKSKVGSLKSEVGSLT